MLEKKIRRYKLMDAHRELVKMGKFLEGRLILKLLREGSVKLYLGDVDYAVERLCENLGCRVNCGRNGYTVRVIL